MEKLNVSIIQSSLFWQDISKNLENFQQKIESIPSSTDIIILPEMFTTGFIMEPVRFAEKKDGATLRWMKKNAELKNALLIGSIVFEEGGKFYNRLFAIHPDGKTEFYDKRHLFAMAGENLNYCQGNERLIVEYKSWKIRPLICYDLRFPVWSRNQDNYDLLIYIANWPSTRSLHWKVLLQARAIENQAYVIGVNRVGKDGNNLGYTGDSCAYDPMGNLISSMKPEQEIIETLAIEKQLLEKIRNSLPFSMDQDEFSIF